VDHDIGYYHDPLSPTLQETQPYHTSYL